MPLFRATVVVPVMVLAETEHEAIARAIDAVPALLLTPGPSSTAVTPAKDIADVPKRWRDVPPANATREDTRTCRALVAKEGG